MYFKISNTAGKQEMEREANALFKYPNLYTPRVLINGLDEVSCPIITMKERHKLSMAIWGLLPSDFKQDWQLFQDVNSTLNINVELVETDLWFADSLKDRRCLVPVTGFFTTLLHKGELYPYYISSKNQRLLFLAGIYTVLDDGFITFSILTGPLDTHLSKYQNLVNNMPLILDREHEEAWLHKETERSMVLEILKTPRTIKLNADPIAKDLYNQGISYDSMLFPLESMNN